MRPLRKRAGQDTPAKGFLNLFLLMILSAYTWYDNFYWIFKIYTFFWYTDILGQRKYNLLTKIAFEVSNFLLMKNVSNEVFISDI